MSGGSGRKNYKGQDQVVQGSPTGEFLVITRFDYLGPCGDLKYYGEAKIGSKEIDCKWHIECYEYENGSISAIKTALNLVTTKATTITLDPSYSATETLLTLPAGFPLKGYLMAGDYVKLETTANSIRRAIITDVLSDTEIVIESPSTAEVGAAITNDDLVITLSNELTKDYARRRWDLREFYFYG